MNHNIFYKKFQIKSDSELNQILTDKDRYTEQAINASIKILEERKSQVHDLNSENENIEPFEIKKEITESAKKQGIDTNLANDIQKEVKNIKSKVQDNIDDLTGPIKRNM